jgi:hypothetical protein
MSQAPKHAIEEKHGRALLDFLGLKYPLERGNPPAPDLLLRPEERKIGLEHTRLFAEERSKHRAKSAAPLQARESLLDSIAHETRLEYDKRASPPVEVKLYVGRVHIKKANIKALGHQIVEVVMRNLSDDPGITEVDNTGDGCLPEALDSITIIRFPEQTSSSFFAPRSTWLFSIDPTYLQQAIDEKAKRLKRYLIACDEVWLLMVQEGNNLSNTIEMPDALWKHAYNFRGFERVFVLRGIGTIHELQSDLKPAVP